MGDDVAVSVGEGSNVGGGAARRHPANHPASALTLSPRKVRREAAQILSDLSLSERLLFTVFPLHWYMIIVSRP